MNFLMIDRCCVSGFLYLASLSFSSPSHCVNIDWPCRYRFELFGLVGIGLSCFSYKKCCQNIRHLRKKQFPSEECVQVVKKLVRCTNVSYKLWIYFDIKLWRSFFFSYCFTEFKLLWSLTRCTSSSWSFFYCCKREFLYPRETFISRVRRCWFVTIF